MATKKRYSRLNPEQIRQILGIIQWQSPSLGSIIQGHREAGFGIIPPSDIESTEPPGFGDSRGGSYDVYAMMNAIARARAVSDFYREAGGPGDYRQQKADRLAENTINVFRSLGLTPDMRRKNK